MQIEELKVADLIPYENNPRANDGAVEAVANSIREFGFKQPIIIDKNNVIVAGHTRTKAAKRLGLETVPVIRAEDLTPEQIKAFRLADNKVGEIAGWLPELLEAELAELENIDMSLFGFDIEQEDEEPEIIEDDPPAEAPNMTQVGQIWQLGRHRLMVGDSTKADDVKRLMEGGVADLLLTDPPYNVNLGQNDRPGSSHNGVKIKNDYMPEDVFIKWLTKALQNADASMKPGAAFYIFYAGLHHTEFDYSLRNVPDWKVYEQLVWVKGHFVMGRNSDYQWQHEPAFYGWKQGAAHYFTDSRAESTVIEDTTAKLSTLKKGELIALCERLMKQEGASTVLRAEKPTAAEMHPTVKPQELICYLMKNSSRPGETVLDLFGGSGSTLIAAQQLGRTCYTMELDTKYADVIIQRYIDFVGTDSDVKLLNP